MCLALGYGEVEEAGQRDSDRVDNAVSLCGKFSKNFSKCLISVTTF